MTTHEKALEAMRLAREVINEMKTSDNKQLASLFKTFEGELMAWFGLLVNWTKVV